MTTGVFLWVGQATDDQLKQELANAGIWLGKNKQFWTSSITAEVIKTACKILQDVFQDWIHSLRCQSEKVYQKFRIRPNKE